LPPDVTFEALMHQILSTYHDVKEKTVRSSYEEENRDA